MVVIIPHSHEELKLIKVQKQIIRNFYDPKILLWRQVPLWINTSFEENDINNLKNTISNVKIFAPEYDEKKSCILCKVKISIAQKQENTELPLVKIKGILTEKEKLSQLKSLADFPLNLNIFKIGNCNKTSNDFYELTSFVWKKL